MRSVEELAILVTSGTLMFTSEVGALWGVVFTFYLFQLVLNLAANWRR